VEIRSTPYVRLIQNGTPYDKWVLPVNMDMTIGRSTGRCNIIVDDSDISRTHCTIRYDGNTGSFLLTDMSTNGTYLKNGARLRQGVQQALQPGTRFVMPGGKIEMEVGVE
jgi:predicted component of type VI protein secretion system